MRKLAVVEGFGEDEYGTGDKHVQRDDDAEDSDDEHEGCNYEDDADRHAGDDEQYILRHDDTEQYPVQTMTR